MKLFLSDLHLGDGKERDDFQYHQQFDELVREVSLMRNWNTLSQSLKNISEVKITRNQLRRKRISISSSLRKRLKR